MGRRTARRVGGSPVTATHGRTTRPLSHAFFSLKSGQTSLQAAPSSKSPSATTRRGIWREDPWVLYNVACVYALLGQTEQAVDCLESAVDQGMGERHWFENDPDLASLRDNPRFKALLERM